MRPRSTKSLQQKWRQFDTEYGVSWRQWLAFFIVFAIGVVVIVGIGV